MLLERLRYPPRRGNDDATHGLGNELGANTRAGEGTDFWWHDAAPLQGNLHDAREQTQRYGVTKVRLRCDAHSGVIPHHMLPPPCAPGVATAFVDVDRRCHLHRTFGHISATSTDRMFLEFDHG